MSEQLLLHIQDTSDHIMSLYIAPVLGRVKLIDGRVSLKEAQEASL
jgi:hypothetical protein